MAYKIDNTMLGNLAGLSEDIKLSLRTIQHCQSIKGLLPVFKEFAVKLLQFSVVIKKIKKRSRNELERKSIALLLYSLKRDILELSNASQDYLKQQENLGKKKIQGDIIDRIEYSINESMKIVKNLQGSQSLDIVTPRTAENERSNHLEVTTEFSPSAYSNTHSTSSNLSGSETDFSYVNRTLQGNENALIKGLKVIINRRKYIMKQAERLVDCSVLKNKLFNKETSSYTAILEECTMFTEEVENFCQMTMNYLARTAHASPDIHPKLRDLQDMASDFASVAISSSQSNNTDEACSLYKLKTAINEMLVDISEAIEEYTLASSKVDFNENFLNKSIHLVKKLSTERNVIGITQLTSTFIDVVRNSEKDLQDGLAKDKLKNYDKIARATIRKAIKEFEGIANDVIMDVEDRSSVNSLEHKMMEVFQCFKKLKLSAMESVQHEPNNAITSEPTRDKHHKQDTEASKDVFKTESDEKGFGGQLSSLLIAIKDNDYRLVEQFANYLMDDVKKIGNMMRKIPMKHSEKLSELHTCYENYFKLAGYFCSNARKAVLTDKDEYTIDNLRKTAQELGHKRIIFIDCCKISLKPWIDIPLSSMEGMSTKSAEMMNFLAEFTSRINQAIETLNATEYFGNHKLRENTIKLQIIINNSASYISSNNRPPKPRLQNDNYRLEVCCVHWACSVLSIIGIFDEVTKKHGSFTVKKTNEQFNKEIDFWISILEDLAFCCSDEEINSEIADRIADLKRFTTKLESKQETERGKESLLHQADSILLKREILCKIILLTELVDVLTRDVSEPMRAFIDPLASLSFASSLSCYNELKNEFETKMETVETMACLAVEDSPSKAQSHLVFQGVDKLSTISQELLCLVSKPRTDESQSLELLKLQWRSKATYLIKVLMIVPEVKFTAVAGVMRHLQSASHIGHLDELVDILKDEGSPLRSYSRCQDSSRSSLQSIIDFVVDDLPADEDSILSSAMDYPLSRDTDLLSNSSPRLESADITYFQRLEDDLKEEDEFHSTLPLNHSPYPAHQLSSTVSTRSCSSQTQDTEIFVEKPSRISPVHPSQNSNKWNLKGDFDDSQTSKQWSESTDIFDSPAKPNKHSRDSIKQSFLNKDSRISKSIAAAAEILRREVEKWEEDGNSVVTVVKQMSHQMLQMADYAKGKGRLRSKIDFINTAKAIAANAKMVAKFAIIIADHCMDETCQMNLLHYAELVPTISTQLKIIASVKAATPDDETADTMLIGNAENLMKYVLATLKAAESASVKFKNGSESTEAMKSKSAALTLQWKRKRDWQRTMESYNAPTNELGLKISTNSPVLSIADL